MATDPLGFARYDRWLQRVGRAAVAFLFLDAAVYHLTPLGWTTTIRDMSARGIPAPAGMLIAAMAISAALAIALLVGFRARYAALGLALYTLAVSSVMYTPFSGLGYVALVLFLKDVGIFGALLALSTTIDRPHGRFR